MRKLLTTLALATTLMVAPRPALAHDPYSDAESNPFKIASYPVAVAGFAIEWIVTRPIHFVVSQPALQRVFNYEPSYNAFDSPEPYPPAGQFSERGMTDRGGQLVVPNTPPRD